VIFASDWPALREVSYWVYALGATCAVAGQVRWLNTGLAFYPAGLVVPIFQVSIILGGAGAGIVYFHEMRSAAPAKMAAFACGALLCAGGISLLLLKARRQQAFAAAAAAAALELADSSSSGALLAAPKGGSSVDLRPVLVMPSGSSGASGAPRKASPATERTSLSTAASTVGARPTAQQNWHISSAPPASAPLPQATATAAPHATATTSSSPPQRQWFDLTLREALTGGRPAASGGRGAL